MALISLAPVTLSSVSSVLGYRRSPVWNLKRLVPPQVLQGHDASHVWTGTLSSSKVGRGAVDIVRRWKMM
jgi:hypothetical protein